MPTILRRESDGYGAFDIQADVPLLHDENHLYYTNSKNNQSCPMVNKTLCALLMMGIIFFVAMISMRPSMKSDVISGSSPISDSVKVQMTAFSSPYWAHSVVHNVEKQHLTTFYVALKLQNTDGLTNELLDVSDPESTSYGKHLSIEAINEKYGPTADQQASVMEFFQSIKGSVVETNLHGDMIRVKAPIEHVESALDTTLGWHTHTSRNTKALRATRAMSIPEHVAEHISFVSLNCPILHSTKPDRVSRKSNTNSVENTEAKMDIGGTSVSILNNLYKVTSTNSKKGSQAFVGFYYEFFSNRDLKDFFIRSGLDTSVANVPLSNIYGNMGNFED
eukprot:gene10147-21160_t